MKRKHDASPGGHRGIKGYWYWVGDLGACGRMSNWRIARTGLQGDLVLMEFFLSSNKRVEAIGCGALPLPLCG